MKMRKIKKAERVIKCIERLEFDIYNESSVDELIQYIKDKKNKALNQGYYDLYIQCYEYSHYYIAGFRKETEEEKECRLEREKEEKVKKQKEKTKKENKERKLYEALKKKFE